MRERLGNGRVMGAPSGRMAMGVIRPACVSVSITYASLTHVPGSLQNQRFPLASTNTSPLSPSAGWSTVPGLSRKWATGDENWPAGPAVLLAETAGPVLALASRPVPGRNVLATTVGDRLFGFLSWGYKAGTGPQRAFGGVIRDQHGANPVLVPSCSAEIAGCR